MDNFCKEKGIKREYSIAKTPQQNGMAERRNRTLIEAARIMLADSKLPTTFWAKIVSTACYVQNRVLVVKPQNKTPYELFRSFKPTLSFRKPFGCHVTILNTLDSLGKFDGKSDEGFFVEYSLSSKDFKVYNTRTKRVEENLHIGFLENKPMIEGNGPKWLFYIDSLTQSMNYTPDVDIGEPKSAADDQNPKEVNAAGQHVNTASPDVNTGSFKLNIVDPSVNTASSYDQDIHKDMFTMGASHTLEATHYEFFSDEDEPEVDLGNITNSYTVPTTPNTRIYKDHPISNVIGDVKSSVQTRRMTKPTSKQGFLSAIEPISIAKALSDSSWVETMQEELLQFKLQQVWILVDLPIGKRAIGTKGGHRQEEGIDYEEVFAPVARIKAIRLFLAYASFMGFLVYQMDVKSAFLYGNIEEEVYVTKPPRFKDPNHPDKVYKVVKALYRMENGDTVPTPIVEQAKLKLDLVRKPVDHTDYRNADHAGCHLDRKSTSGSVQFLGDKLVCWSSKKQNCVSIAIAKSEYVDVSGCCAQVLWMRTQLTDYGFFFDKVPIYCDSKSAIAISCNPVQHTRTKHIDVRYHFIKDHVEKGTIELYFVGTEFQLADLFTKSLPEARFKFLVEKLGMMSRET
ncbi:retrovirus-related pol polyprotein from transposon TNT 1-94 [Tanacetum coccineum]